ncbi:hypothetical protein K492DRAFT_73886 [Lichtheimia hyalospora FSU 10163]|nr:hypothetical protein K492DRAFT_73886 [Lichtheimia hyalospora FSU 10163]
MQIQRSKQDISLYQGANAISWHACATKISRKPGRIHWMNGMIFTLPAHYSQRMPNIILSSPIKVILSIMSYRFRPVTNFIISIILAIFHIPCTINKGTSSYKLYPFPHLALLLESSVLTDTPDDDPTLSMHLVTRSTYGNGSEIVNGHYPIPHRGWMQ